MGDSLNRPSLAKAHPEVVYEFGWQGDAECQEYARDHLLSDTVRRWMRAVAAETGGLARA